MNSTPKVIDQHDVCHAIVIGRDLQQTVFAGSKNTRTMRYVPAGLMADPPWLLDSAAHYFRPAGQGVLILPWCPLSETGPAPSPYVDQLREFMQRARAGGWECTDAAIRHESGWITFTHKGFATVHVGVLDGISPDKCTLFDPFTWDADEIGRALVRYRLAVGVPWRSTAGVAGLAMVRDHFARLKTAAETAGRPFTEPWWQWHAPEIPAGQGDLIWDRRPTADERKMKWIHKFDIRSMYLAAANVAHVGYGRPEQTGAIQYEPSRAGLWRIVARASIQWGRGLPPYLNPNRIASDGTTWITNRGMQFLANRDLFPEVLDSYTCAPRQLGHAVTAEQGSRMYRPITDILRDALKGAPDMGHQDECACADCRFRDSLKDTYTHMFGLMATDTALIRRMDHAATVIDMGRFNMLDKFAAPLTEIGAAPVKVKTDAVWYIDSDEKPDKLAELLGVGDQIGKFRHVGTYSLTEWLAEERKEKGRRRGR